MNYFNEGFFSEYSISLYTIFSSLKKNLNANENTFNNNR